MLLYPFLFLTRELGYWSKVKEGAYTDPLEKAPSKVRKDLGKIYRTLLFIDFLIRSLVKVRLTLLFKDIVICDRFAYDLLMELDLSGLRSAFFEKMVLYMASTPQIGFFVNAPVQLIIQRRPEFTAANIKAKQCVYRKFARVLGFRTIDTCKSFDENQEYVGKETLLAIESAA